MKPFTPVLPWAAVVAISMFVLCSCNKATETDPPPGSTDTIPTIHQGVYGKVYFWQGDFMPTVPPAPPRGSITPVKRTVVVHVPTRADSVEQVNYSAFYRAILTQRIGLTTSNDAGFYQIELPPGRYSFFIVEDTLFYANGGDGYGYILPATVVQDSLTKLDINITYKATF